MALFSQQVIGQYPLEQLGVEKSMAGAVLIVPPVVEMGDVSVVAKEGLLESSLSLCSWAREEAHCSRKKQQRQGANVC